MAPEPPAASPLKVASIQPLVRAWRLDRTFHYLIPDDLIDRVQIGSLVRIGLGARKVRGVVREIEERTEDSDLDPIRGVVLATPVAPPPHDSVLDDVAVRYVTPRAAVFERAVPPRVRVKLPDRPNQDAESPPDVPSGYRGLEELRSTIEGGGSGIWVWQAAPSDDRARLLATLVSWSPSGSVLVSVPEVRYASRLLDEISSYHPNPVRLDSAVEPKVRAAGMVALAGGSSSISVLGLGGRAACLAAARDLRLIVLDEEHHPALKEDRSPRYDARWVARRRAEAEGAVCVFVSSTPSLEATWKARRGEWGAVTPTRDKERSSRPLVLLAEPPAAGLSPLLHREIRDELRSGGRVGLLVPGAGFSRAVWCSTCRNSVRCTRCEAGMSYGAETKTVHCTRCGLSMNAPETCRYCGGSDFRYVGAGSQRIGAQLERMFPRASVARVDPNVLEAGEALDPKIAEADIYVTTWIGTKPEIRPDVKLVGVLDADWLIRRPDLRAAERGYHALAAMAAWAGASQNGGRLVVQTVEPNHHSIQAVVRGDHGFFCDREAEQRRELGYPPFSELVKVRAEGDEARQTLEEVRAGLTGEDLLLGPIEVSLPTPARPDAPKALEVLIKTQDAQRVASMLRVILPRVKPGTRLRVDVDPR